MASAAQLAANRANAKSSTGPRTEEGKQNSSANAIKFGLFSAKNCVHPEEQDEYDQLSAGLWDELQPQGNIEGMLAIEIVRSAWRLRRCANAEGSLATWNRMQTQIERTDRGDKSPDHQPADPILYSYTASPQSAIDRARGQPQTALRRAMSDLGNRQTERRLRMEMLPADMDPATLGLANVKQLLAGINHEMQRQLRASQTQSTDIMNQFLRQLESEDAQLASACRREPAQIEANSPPPSTYPSPENEIESDASTKETQSPQPQQSAKPTQSAPSAIARNAPCSCGSGLKHKRCCGPHAPAMLQTAA